MKKRSIFLLTILLSAWFLCHADGHFVYEIGFGGGIAVGNQNLSPWGVAYRQYYDKPTLNLNANVAYLYADKTLVGLKYQMFTTTGDYQLSTIENIIENVTVNYIAPQIGLHYSISRYFAINAQAGGGYMRYAGKGLNNKKEYSFYSDLIAANADFSLEYKLNKRNSLLFNISGVSTLYSKDLYLDIDNNKQNLNPDKWNTIKVNKVDLALFWKIYF
ncbi:MAG: hypothetical protein LBN23_02575 [Paludibacter sp.]|jgi:hypothetical protein|nr:hypothetical protein [Paludibacter sp.]